MRPRRQGARHLAVAIAGGLVLLGVHLLCGRLRGDASGAAAVPSPLAVPISPSGLAVAAAVFVPAWGALAALLLWAGRRKSGFSVRAELPGLLLVIGVPALVVGATIWCAG